MQIDNIFGFLVPKDRKFFPLFNECADNIVATSELLVTLLKENDREKIASLVKKIKEAEHKGDDITMNLLKELNGTFITPFDREDMHELITTMDSVVDYINVTAKRIDFYKLAVFPDQFLDIAKLILSASLEIQNVLRNVKKVNDFKHYIASYRKISVMESQVDDIYHQFISHLFENEVNAIDLIKKRDVLTALEKTIDKCEDIAKLFSTLVVKIG